MAEWNTRPLIGEMAIATVTFRPLCPHTCLYARSPCLALPWLLEVQILYPHSSTKTECQTTPRFINQLAYAVLFSSTSGLFRSAGRGRASLMRKSMPSRVLATVRSCMNGLSGSRLRSSLFICHKVSRQFSFIISRQFRISSSTRPLFRPPAVFPGSFPLVCISLL